jgi:hypothetical protein
MDEQTLNQLDRRIDEHHQYLCERLHELTEAVRTLHAMLLARFDEHERYHQSAEHRWGLIKLAERHPFRLASLAFTAAALLSLTRPETAHWLAQWVQRVATLVLK